jgi:hypothetical protein
MSQGDWNWCDGTVAKSNSVVTSCFCSCCCCLVPVLEPSQPGQRRPACQLNCHDSDPASIALRVSSSPFDSLEHIEIRTRFGSQDANENTVRLSWTPTKHAWGRSGSLFLTKC